MLWLAVGLLVYFFSASPFAKSTGLLLWLAGWSHFFLDSIEYGIMWLWPFSRKIYAFRNKERTVDIGEHKFFPYWFKFVRLYSQSLTFYLEILIILTVIFVHF